jgi:teichuronic acid exporter
MSLKQQATSGLVWTFAQQFGDQGISFIVSIILARLLLPAEFGLIGMVTVFIAIGQSLVTAGLTQSLIRDQNSDQEDLSTVFYFNLIASAFIYLLVYFLAPFIADFYQQLELTKIIRVLCLIFIIGAFSSVQMSRLTKLLDFKTQTIISLPSTILSGIVGIVLAYLGYGVWSLVWSRISLEFLKTIQLWFYSKWSPSFIFNYEKFKDHFNFGYKLTLSGLLDTIFQNIYILIIGRYFAAAQVGYYTRSQSLRNLPINNLSKALNKVTYPLFSSIQNDEVRLKRGYSILMRIVLFVISPILILGVVLATPIFRFLLTEKWVPAVPFFQILCIAGILYPINAYNLNILKVKGKSALFLKLEILKKIIISISIVIAIQFGIYGLLYSQIFISIIGFIINSYNTGKLISYDTLNQIKDIYPILLLASLMGALVYLLDFYFFKDRLIDPIRIIIGGGIGLGIYISGSHILKFECLYTIIDLIKKRK